MKITPPGPIHMRIVQAVIRDIESRRLTSGTYLPSSRRLAEQLGVNRKTIVQAYDDLVAQGWLTAQSTRGTIVSHSLPNLPPQDRRGAASRPEQASYPIAAPPARPLALPDGPGFKLDEGAPDGRLFPPELLVRAYKMATHRLSRSNGMQYRDPRGSSALRRAIADMLSAERGLVVTGENICITRGSQNGIFLAGQILLQPGDAIVVEELAYEPAVAAFRALNAVIIPVGLDNDGMKVEEVEHACRSHRVKAVFATPHHQFPTTVPLPPERRLQLVELARQNGFAIIEDDYDHEFHFDTLPLTPIAAYAPNEVIYIGSLSKLLLPTLRIGYIAAPAHVIDAIAHRISITDGMGSALNEETVTDLIESGELRRHARKSRKIYAQRRLAFSGCLEEFFGDAVDYSLPGGGLALWLRFRTEMGIFEKRAADAGLRFARSQSFITREGAPRGLRIGFASLNEVEQRDALALLRQALP